MVIKINKVLAARIFVPFAAGFFISNIFRSINAVIAPDLEGDLALTAADLGLLSSIYFFAFACFQLPLGLLLDKFGPRRVQSLMLLVASSGAVVFASAQVLHELVVARTLIGLGLSGCLMASFKAFSLWFESNRLPVINGYLLACGGLGAMTATIPVEIFIGATSWRDLFALLSVCCIGISMLVWYTVPETSSLQSNEGLARQIITLGRILKSPPFLTVAPMAFFSHGFGVAVITLWSGPWLREVAGFDRVTTAQTLLLLMLAVTIGSVAWGLITSYSSRFNFMASTVTAIGGISFLVVNIIVFIQPSYGQAYLWIAYGFTLTSGNLLYANLTSQFGGNLSGRLNAALNLVVFVGAFLFQWGFGIVIDYWHFTDGTVIDGYQVAFAIAIVFQAGSLLWFLLRRHLLKCQNSY